MPMDTSEKACLICCTTVEICHALVESAVSVQRQESVCGHVTLSGILLYLDGDKEELSHLADVSL